MNISRFKLEEFMDEAGKGLEQDDETIGAGMDADVASEWYGAFGDMYPLKLTKAGPDASDERLRHSLVGQPQLYWFLLPCCSFRRRILQLIGRNPRYS